MRRDNIYFTGAIVVEPASRVLNFDVVLRERSFVYRSYFISHMPNAICDMGLGMDNVFTY